MASISLKPSALVTADLAPCPQPSNLSRSFSFSFPGHEEFGGSRCLATRSPGRWGYWRRNASLFPFLKSKKKDRGTLKEELLEVIAPLDRGADATPEDQERIDRIARELESINAITEPLKSDFLNGKWELIYTTSNSILQRGQNF